MILFLSLLLSLFWLAPSADGASCSGTHIIHVNQYVGDLTIADSASEKFTGELSIPGEAVSLIEGQCITDSQGVVTLRFRRQLGSGADQFYSGKASQNCGQLVFDGIMTSKGRTSPWYSVPALKSQRAGSCRTSFKSPDGRIVADDCQVPFRSNDEANTKQCLLQRFIWGPAGFPTKKRPSQIKKNAQFKEAEFRGVRAVEKWTVDVSHGFTSDLYFFKSLDPQKRLAIFHQGHIAGLTKIGGGDTIQFFLDRGYDVLALPMVLFGEYQGPVSNHDQIFDYLRLASENKNYDALRIFLEPTVVALNEALARMKYDQVVMTGISGGGWTTTWVSALDSRIDVSIPVSGSLPLSLRQDARDIGDLEQYRLEIYRHVGYMDLYALGAKNRTQLQILSQFDSCCFAVPQAPSYVDLVQSALSSIGGNFQFALDPSHKEHKISDFALQNFFAPLLGH